MQNQSGRFSAIRQALNHFLRSGSGETPAKLDLLSLTVISASSRFRAWQTEFVCHAHLEQ
jgi:hypothetical protein